MSEIERRTGRSNLKKTMKSQLFSMLKGVMAEEEEEDDQDQQEFQIFDQEDTDEEDQAATEANTTLLTQCEFERDAHDRFQTTKGLKPNTVDTQNTFFNQMELSRKTTRKFQTISPNSINNFMGEEPLFSSNLFSINQIGNSNSNANNNCCNMILSPYLLQAQSPSQMNMNLNMNQRTNWNSMPMPATNSFSFKAPTPQKPNGGNKSCFYFNNNSQSQSQLQSQCCNQYQQQSMFNGANSGISNCSGGNLYQNLHPQAQNGNNLFSKLDSLLNTSEEIDEGLYMKYKDNFSYLIKNQQSSRILQYLLDKTDLNICHLIFEEISLDEQLCSLLYDPYANYFLLKLFYFLNEDDRMIFLTQIASDFDNLSINKISTYPIQCIVEHLISHKEKEVILNSLLPHLMKVSLDVYGTHVIEKMLVCFDYSLIKPISTFIIDNFLFLASNANGLCIVKKEVILEYKKDNYLRLKEQLEKNALILIQNPYGNYALQMVIDNWQFEDIELILLQFVDKCSTLSIQKFSSNVIEKCIQKSELFLSNFIREVCMNKNAMMLLMMNNFGQYVLQTALKCSQYKNKFCLISALSSNLEMLTEKKLSCKWKSIISAYSSMI